MKLPVAMVGNPAFDVENMPFLGMKLDFVKPLEFNGDATQCIEETKCTLKRNLGNLL